jgi:predicted DsbA family dithiol-disulfide isomerase
MAETTEAPPKVVTLDVVSDPVCPWCLIGHLRLKRALEVRPEHPLRLVWRPFRLNPDMPPEGMDRRAYYEAKFGGAEAADRVIARIEAAAEADGAPLDLARIPRQPQTLDAHRLMRLAREADRETALAEALFRRFFLTCEDIGDRAVLASAAEEAGLDAAAALARLDAGAARDETLAEEAEARALGIGGVPAYIIGGRRLVGGAQPTQAWIDALEALAGGRG